MGKENTKQKTGNAVLNALKKSNMTAMAAILVIMIIIASVVSPHFLNIYNLQSVLRDLAFIGMIGIAQSLLLLVGELDLSVGKIACLCGILSGMLMVNAGVNPWLSLLVGMILGVVFGFINGIIITRLRLNSMVATIGMQGVYGGVNLVITKGKAVTGIPDEPVDIAWELDRYDVMNIQGEITEEALEEEGTLVTLSALLTYREDETRQARHQCTVCLYPRTLKPGEAREQKIREELTEAEAKDREDKIWHLPRTIGGKAVSYYRQMDSRGAVLIGMALITGILLLAQKKQKEMQEETQRSRQLLRDYPEIVGKLTLYLGAGMTVKRAFRKVVEDYERQKETTGVRCAYEEMQKTLREMESGHTEAESYENFGRRCKVQAYLRFGALLSQNLRKGTRGLTQLLKMESIQAFEDRKARARRLGEEAGTKLLLPMFLMLAVVLVIVIVPAFLSMQIL